MLFKTSRQISIALLGLVLAAQAVAAQSAPRQTGPTNPVSRVTGVQLRPIRVSPGRMKCPVKNTFYGRISTDGPATVKYTFATSDGKSWPVTTLTFSAKAMKPVSVTWETGKPGHTVNAWIQLQVISPNKLDSTKATFILRCE